MLEALEPSLRPSYQEAVKYSGGLSPLPALILSICEAPWDDGPVYVRGRCRGIRFDPGTASVNIHFIETQLYNAGLADFCARAFDVLGDQLQAEEFRHEARRLEALVRCRAQKTSQFQSRHQCSDRGFGFEAKQLAHSGIRRNNAVLRVKILQFA